MNIKEMSTDDLQDLFNQMRGTGDYRITDVLNELRKRRKNEKKTK